MVIESSHPIATYGHYRTIIAEPKKERRIGLRLSALAKTQIEKAAELQGRSISDFVLAAALSEACQVIEQQMVLKLCLEDSMALADAFINEPKPHQKAIEAGRRYGQRMKHNWV